MYGVVHCIAIYPLDSNIQPLNDRGKMFWSLDCVLNPLFHITHKKYFKIQELKKSFSFVFFSTASFFTPNLIYKIKQIKPHNRPVFGVFGEFLEILDNFCPDLMSI